MVLCSKNVSVPYWGSLSSNAQLMKDKNALKTEFPSPTGVLYLLILILACYQLINLLVSVPYWGSLSSNMITLAKAIKSRFPSPTGVLYLLMQIISKVDTSGVRFPSPTGVLYLLIGKRKNKLHILWQQVSVPYWGSLSSNQIFLFGIMDEGFPSPTGVLYLLI